MEAAKVLNASSTDVIANIGSVGVPVHKYVPEGTRVHVIEFSPEFATLAGIPCCAMLEPLPIKSHTVDKIIIIALLHHFSEAERAWLYGECHRILKADGALVIADVEKESQQAEWLNGVVDRYNPYGHSGNFFEASDSLAIESCGFSVRSVERKDYMWTFASDTEMVDCLYHTFYMSKARPGDILFEAQRVLGCANGGVRWGLLYFIATPDASSTSCRRTLSS